jgi:hypothetical protein
MGVLGVGQSRAESASGATTAAGTEQTPVIQSVLSPPRWFKGNDGRFHMAYELMLTNAFPLSVNVASLQVLGPGARRLEALSGMKLEAAMTRLGTPGVSTTELPPATVGIVWLDLSFASRRGLPRHVKHRLSVDIGPGLPVGPIITDTGGSPRSLAAPRP